MGRMDLVKYNLFGPPFRGYREGIKRVAFPFPCGAILGFYAVQIQGRYSPEGTPPPLYLTGQFLAFALIPLLCGIRPDNPRTIRGHLPDGFGRFPPRYLDILANGNLFPEEGFF